MQNGPVERAWEDPRVRQAWIEVLLFLHVLGAITAVGPSLTYAMWRQRAEGAGPTERVFVLRTIGWIDRRMATPSFLLQAATGTALVLLLHIRFFHTAWLLCGVAIYVVTAVFAGAVYVPVVRRQRELAERVAADPSNDAARAAYQSVASKGRVYGRTAVLLTMTILYFMIAKPALWSAA